MTDDGHLLTAAVDWKKVVTERDRLKAEEDRLGDVMRKISDRLDSALDREHTYGPPLLLQIISVVSDAEKLKVLSKALSAAADAQRKMDGIHKRVEVLDHACGNKEWFVKHFLDTDVVRDASGTKMVTEIEGFLDAPDEIKDILSPPT